MFLKLQPTIRAEGIAGAATLKIVPSARASAMGDTFTGVADDVNTIFFNPAGLSLLQRPSVSFMSKQMIGNTNLNAMSINFSLKDNRHIGFGVITFNGGMAEIVSGSITRTIRAQEDYLLICSYSPEITKDGMAGVNIKALKSTLAEEYSANAYALDIGVMLSQNKVEGNSFGFVIQNIDVGNGIKYIDYSDPLPLTYRAGWGYHKILNKNKKFLFCLDWVKIYGDVWKINLGSELVMGDSLVLRIGYKYGYAFTNLSTGIGIYLGKIKFDIAGSLLGNLGTNYQSSLSMNFCNNS